MIFSFTVCYMNCFINFNVFLCYICKKINMSFPFSFFSKRSMILRIHVMEMLRWTVLLTVGSLLSILGCLLILFNSPLWMTRLLLFRYFLIVRKQYYSLKSFSLIACFHLLIFLLLSISSR
jgi:hypothetical protein